MNRSERRQVIPSAAARQAAANRRRIVLFASLGVLAVVILVAVILGSRTPESASVAPTLANVTVGQTAPGFAVSTTDGPFDLASAAGKPVLLEVFATWCPHCQREVPVLDHLYGTFKNRVRFVAVSGSADDMLRSAPESQADVVKFATTFNATYPVAFDPQLDVAHKYLQGGFPTVVLIGADGKIAAIRDGEIPEADLSKALAAAAAGKKPDPKLGAKG